MSLFATIKSALGLNRPLEPRELAPFRIAPSANEAIAALPTGRALHIATVPVDGGRALRTWEGAADMLEGEIPTRVVITEEDDELLSGMVLEYEGTRFSVRLTLNTAAKETPNPNGRQYETDRFLAEGRPQSYTDGDEAAPPLAKRILGIEGVRRVLFREHVLTIQRENEVPWSDIDREVDAQLREYFLLCGRSLPERRIEESDTELEAAVRQVLEDTLLPYVHSHGGNIDLVGIDDGVVIVQLEGACNTCPASQITLRAGVRKSLMDALPGRVLDVQSA